MIAFFIHLRKSVDRENDLAQRIKAMDAAEALEQLAQRFEVYASDIEAMIARGYYHGKHRLVEEARATLWNEAASEARMCIAFLNEGE